MNQNLPENLLYNTDYSWIRIDGNVATLGIIKPACERVKEFVFISLPQVGREINKGETYVSLEALKWSGHLSSPFTGDVIEVHEELFDGPEIINNDPYGEGWIAKISIKNEEEKKDLLDYRNAEIWLNKIDNK